MRLVQRRRRVAFVIDGATWSRSSRSARCGCDRRASDPDSRRRVRAARPGCGTSGVYGRIMYLTRAHTSGSYPAVEENADRLAGTP
eukprot:34450-Pleurochrysis_carterae.AAC.1